MKITLPLAIAGLCLLAGMAIGWQVHPTPPPTYRDVIVHDTVIEKQAPETVLSVIERIKWRVVEPTVIARGDTPDPERLRPYCQPVVAESVTTAPVLPPSSGKYDGKTLKLFSVTSDGKLFAQETQTGTPLEWVNRGDMYEVRTTRSGFKLFKALPKVLVPVGAFALGVLVAK
jgi:hypothetical protein